MPASTTALIGDHSTRLSAFLYPLGIWVLMAVVAVGNGIFRELVIIPSLGEYQGHVLSTLLLVGAILVITFGFFTLTSLEYTFAEVVLIGTMWTVFTVGFEFLVGYIEGTPPAVTIGQYDVFSGQIWILVPITLFLSPIVFGWYVSP